MKRLIVIVFFSLLISTGFSQPAGYTPGTWAEWSFNGRSHGVFKAAGWNFTDGKSHFLLFFGGDGQLPNSFATLDDAAPGSLITRDGWNGITAMPDGSQVKWCFVVLPALGVQPTLYAADVNFIMNNIGLSPGDTADRTKFHIGGLSGGPPRMWDWMNNLWDHNSPYRAIWGTTISMSTAAAFNNYTAIATGKKHYIWYGNPAGDGNSGTPYSFSQFLYNDLPGTPNVDKRFKVNPTGTHSDNTWGMASVPLSCLYTGGTDSATNRWIWMAQAYGTDNAAPIANAGADQTVLLPTTSATLNGSLSSDPNGNLASYQWFKISGPAGGNITTPGPGMAAVTTTVTSLQAGLYTYRLVVTDAAGLWSDDTVNIIVTSGVASTNRILLDIGNHFWPWNARENPEILFDNTLDKRIDQNGNIAFSAPMKFAVELRDSVWDNLRLRFYNAGGASQVWKVTFYDSTRAQLATYQFNQNALVLNGYSTMPGMPDTIQKPVKWIFFELDNPFSDVREIEIYGDRNTKVTTLWKGSYTPTVLPDPGIRHFGGSAIGDKDTAYLKLSNGKPLYPSFRAPSTQFTWNARDGVSYNQQPLTLSRFGNFGNIMLRFQKDHNVPVMFYMNGASMGAWGPTLGLAYGSSYNALTQLQAYKDILPGSDSTNHLVWINTGRSNKATAYLYGNNPSATLDPSYTFEGGAGYDVSPGQNKIATLEIDNEPDKDWMNNTGYHSPEVLLAKVKMAWDSIKSITPDMRVHVGALLSMDTVRLKAMYFINYWKYSNATFPADGFNFNQYISTAYAGQPHSGTENAISPEQFEIKKRFTKFREFRDRFYPGREMRWTEIGFSPWASSDYSVAALPGLADSVICGMLMIRCIEQSAVVKNGITTVYNYFHTSDGSGTFGGMYQVRERFNPTTFSYIGSDRLPIWYMYAMRVNALWDYKGWSDHIIDGDSTGIHVYKREHVTDPAKKVYTIYNGTYNGLYQTDYLLDIGNATSATLITYQFGSETGIQTPLAVSSTGTITVPVVNEIPQYIVVSSATAQTKKISKKAGVRWNIKTAP